MKKLILLPLLFSLSPVFGADLPSIAVADFTSDKNTTLTHGLPDVISDDLVNSKLFDVYERDKLNSVMREQGLQASGFVDPQTAEKGSVNGIVIFCLLRTGWPLRMRGADEQRHRGDENGGWK
jgi:hypothetical protein